MSADPPNRPKLMVVSDARGAIDDAKEVKPEDFGGGGGDGFFPRELGLQPLGVLGNRYFLADSHGQFQTLKATDFRRQTLIVLTGENVHEIEKFFFRNVGRRGERKEPDYDAAVTALSVAIAKKGIFDPAGRLRDGGAWRGDEGELVLHCGDAVWIAGKWHRPGMVGRHFYQRGKALPRPWDGPAIAGSRGAGQQVLTLLESWNWKRGTAAARLALGWIACAMIGGALDFRPAAWVTGPAGTGKSTLAHALEALFDGALVSVSDASAAGIRQKLGLSTQPVVLDELEADEDPRQGQRLIALLRQAASGGLVIRGGADHAGAEFPVRSCFLCLSILVPPLLKQDRSRIAILELAPLRHGALVPDIAPRKLRELGQRLLRRLVDGWERWPETLALYRAALGEIGRDARGADLYGTLLAAADLLLYDELPDHDTLREIVDQIGVKSVAEADDDAGDDERCLQHLLTQAVPLEGALHKRPVAEWIGEAAITDAAIAKDYSGELRPRRNEAWRILGRYGLKVMQLDDRRCFAVACAHAELGKLFAGTHWAGRSGAVGVWTQTLRRLPSAQPSGKNLWFAGATAKATLVPLELVLAAPETGTPSAPSQAPLALESDGDDA